MGNKKNSHTLVPRADIYIWIMFVFVVVIAVMNWIVAIPAVGVWLFLFILNIYWHSKRKKEVEKYIEDLEISMDAVTKDILINFPMPLVLVTAKKNIVWYNSSFKKLFNVEDLLGKHISECIPQIRWDKQTKLEFEEKVSVSNKEYTLICSPTKEKSENYQNAAGIMYFADQTEYINLINKYNQDKPCTAMIVVDNYEDIMQGVPDEVKPLLMADIDGAISRYMSFTGGILKKYERDRYIVVFKNKHLNTMIEDRFSILDKVKEISRENKIPVTLSIGIGSIEDDMVEEFSSATAAIDIAMGRGGDQVVLKDQEGFRFFGGRSREFERRTKVKSRVIAYALRELISQADNVIIMGHENPDFDALGAAIGICSLCRIQGKTAKIVISKYNNDTRAMVDKFKETEEYKDTFVKNWEASSITTQNTLLVVVDSHRASFTDSPELLEEVKNIVVIDHHRRGAEYISRTALTYQEPYASSTCELVAEMLQHIDSNIKIMPLEAEAMYVGILMDTKDFSLKTGVRTFEAAAFLRRKGVDIVSAKKMLQNDFATYSEISEAIARSEILSNGIALSYIDKEIKDVNRIIAKTADELLKILGIKASFVLGKSGDEVLISGRSSGDINVQVILEKIGGGGHFMAAGAQLKETSIEEGLTKLKKTIEEYIEEMKKEGEK